LQIRALNLLGIFFYTLRDYHFLMENTQPMEPGSVENQDLSITNVKYWGNEKPPDNEGGKYNVPGEVGT
jgi:hypothetical protein